MCRISPNLVPPPLKLGTQIFFENLGTNILYKAMKFGDDPIIVDFRGDFQTRCPKVPQTFTPIFSKSSQETPDCFSRFAIRDSCRGPSVLRLRQISSKCIYRIPRIRRRKTPGGKWGPTPKLGGNSPQAAAKHCKFHRSAKGCIQIFCPVFSINFLFFTRLSMHYNYCIHRFYPPSVIN